MTMIQQGYQFGKCIVSQMGTTFAYDCEYLGPTPRLAFTPLTERAYLSLTIALNTFQCGTLSGPPGTGKSDTIKDLSMVSCASRRTHGQLEFVLVKQSSQIKMCLETLKYKLIASKASIASKLP